MVRLFDIITGIDGTTLKADIHEGKWWMHLDIKGAWSVSKYKTMLAQFIEALSYMHDKGIDEVWVAIPDDDPMLLKFEKMFGFIYVLTSDGTTFLRRDTWV